MGWQNWRADVGRSLSPIEERELRVRVAAQREWRERETRMNQERAARRAFAVWPIACDLIGALLCTLSVLSCDGGWQFA
jgi:hypothetical protein